MRARDACSGDILKELARQPGEAKFDHVVQLSPGSYLAQWPCCPSTSVVSINAWHMSLRLLLLDVQQAVSACSSRLDSAGAADVVAASGLVTALSSFLTVLTALSLSDNTRSS